MDTFNLSEGGHEWEKENLVTLGKKKPHDIYKCRKCGLTGKSYRLGTIEIREADLYKMKKCKGVKKAAFVKVTRCMAVGSEFSGLTPGSVHRIVHPPKGENNNRGEWVMGKTEPVLLLSGEYIYQEERE